MNFKERALFAISIPVQKHVTKKNNRSIFKNKATGRLFPGKSSHLVLAEKNIKNHLNLYRSKYNITHPFDFPIHCVFIFHFDKEQFYTKQGKISLKLPDLSNLVQLPEDCLQSCGIIKDDTLIHSLDFSRRIPSDANRLEIFILEYRDEVT